MRKLATIRRISNIIPIKGADNIELAKVDGWQVVVKKGEFQKDDLCVYFEIDSFLPIREEFEFLRKSSYTLMGDISGFRLRTIKLRKKLSQGLALPVNIFKELDMAIFGDDVTDILGVLKYESPISTQFSGIVKSTFPSWISKTGEERIQNLDLNEIFMDMQLVCTEKLDGTSTTFYLKDGEFGVCSKNLDLLESKENTYWQVANQNKIKSKMLQVTEKYELNNFALQGEIIGEGIQENKYKVKGHQFYLFNIYNIDTQKYINWKLCKFYANFMNIKCVPEIIINKNINFMEINKCVDNLLLFAEGKSKVNKDQDREGLVFKTLDNGVSFKVINNKFLLEYE